MGESAQRRLAAIVAADIVGYSRLMSEDEEGTLSRVTYLRDHITEPTIESYGGRIVKRTGDGALIEFSSVVDAVRSAIDVQRKLFDDQSDYPDNERIVLRIGINLGDVLIEEEDIFGDGVNIAARLEQLCAPGEVVISGSAYDQLEGRSEFLTHFLGEQNLKNISRPVRAYRLLPNSDAGTKEEITRTPTHDLQMAHPLPDKPSIAVLPFDNMSGDPEQEYFADGIAEDVITALSRNRELFVIARNSSFGYRGRSTDIRTVGQELGVAFVLEGSVRRAGDRVRITAQLIEANSGSHIWAERFDRPVTDIFEVQDEITVSVAGAVGSEIRSTGIRRTAGKSLEQLHSWERLMKAYWHLYRTNPDDNRKGQEICRQEIAKNNSNAAFYSALVYAHAFELMWAFGSRAPADVMKDGMAAGRTAIELDANDETAHGALGFLLWLSGNHDEAEREGRAAVDLNPNYAWGHQLVGCAQGYAGSEYYETSMERLKYAIRLGPRDVSVHWCYAHMALVSFVSDKYGETIEHARAAIRLDPTNGTAHRLLAAALVRENRLEEGQAAWERAWEVQPLDLKSYFASVRRAIKRDEDSEKYINAMRTAGGLTE